MQLTSDKSSKRVVAIWITVSLLSALGFCLIAALHLISVVMAFGIWSVLTFGVGVLLNRLQPNVRISLTAHRRLIFIYAGCGVFAGSKAIAIGWTKDDTVGLSALICVWVIFMVSYFQRKKTTA